MKSITSFLMIAMFMALSLTTFAQQPPNKAKPDTSTYILVGKLGDFQLLYQAVKSPGDVTPNQEKGIENWVNSSLRKIDAVVTSKKEADPAYGPEVDQKAETSKRKLSGKKK